MEYFKTVVMGVGLPDRHEGYSSKSIFADIVLIDRAESGLDPLLFQLDNAKIDMDLSLVENGYVQLPKGAFLLMGHVQSIERKKKLIHLASDPMISPDEIISKSVIYKHLIIASGLDHAPSDQKRREQFSIALQALIDALKIQKQIPGHLKNPWASYVLRKNQAIAAKIEPESKYPSAKNLAHDHISALDCKNANLITKRNFELQL